MEVTVRLAEYLWRPLTASSDDTDFVVSQRQSQLAHEAFFSGRITREDHQRFLKLAAQRDEINWIIERRGERVGASGIFHLDRQNRRAEGGRIVMTLPELYLMNMLVTHYVAFEFLGLNKVCGETMATNTAVNRALERAGVTQEGVLREHAFKDGTAVDVYVWGVLARDWPLLKRRFAPQFGEPSILLHGVDLG